jgi:hypothetical protein
MIDYQLWWQQDEKIIKAGIIVKPPEEDDKIKRFTSIVKDNLKSLCFYAFVVVNSSIHKTKA